MTSLKSVLERLVSNVTRRTRDENVCIHLQVRPESDRKNVDGPVDNGFVREVASGDSSDEQSASEGTCPLGA